MSLWSFGQSVALSQDPYPEFTVIIREPVQMDKDEIVRLTKSLGEGWAYPHVQRVSRLAEHISGTLPYNPDWFWYAAHLHDWGAFPRYRLPGVDQEFLRQFSTRVRELFPNCPAGREQVIAEHACQKYSGRVGRSASAKRLDEEAIRLAVIAHIRHAETRYDALLAQGTDRRLAREEVRSEIDQVLDRWGNEAMQAHL